MQEQANDDAKKVSQSTRVKARKQGDKLFKAFGYDNPVGSMEGLVERWGVELIAQILSRQTGCIIQLPKKKKP